ncbi:hypothetical protein I4U23_003907 [Adineta vaga]|nr:hypothetical protein I4U23_003907 [Adineta vaga]
MANVSQVVPSVSICTFPSFKSYLMFFAYSSLFITSFFCITLIILSILSGENVRLIRAIPRQQRQQIRAMNKKDFQLVRCLFAHDIVYIGGNIFINLYYIYIVIRFDREMSPLESVISSFFNNFFTMLQQLSFCTTFFIFISLSKAFRNELRRIIYKMVKKNLVPIQDEENNNNQENIA